MFLSVGRSEGKKLKRVLEKEESSAESSLFGEMIPVQHERVFCCFYGMIPWPHCGLGNYKRPYFTIPISVSMNDCTHESTSVSASVSARV